MEKKPVNGCLSFKIRYTVSGYIVHLYFIRSWKKKIDVKEKKKNVRIKYFLSFIDETKNLK